MSLQSRPPLATSPGSEGSARVATIRLTHVLGVDDLATPDATEDYHEASRLYPGVTDPFLVGAARLERSPEMRVTASRSVKQYTHRPALALPPPSLGQARLADVVEGRRSRHDYGDAPLSLDALATLLHCAYGVTGASGPPQTFRAAPSGGALYPLELYVACLRVEGAQQALHHYDPLLHRLEILRPLAGPEELAGLTPYDELVTRSAALVVVTGVLWRSRFKYGQRAYRFALLEAGHAAHGFLLAAEGLGLASTPVGGFYDRRVDDVIGADGLHETALYLLPVGRRSS